ncbi:MAG: sigma-70 family RNA polymerase sigma factor [Mucilaginibacter sp.]|jgi:RNA polymerase sigma-70 factor (ECF subfamily)|uniref:sigma-70 family RNA polymerase sigma factor n=1 Tax=Mucilaginibacter sp. TaxID=1882438 RepID=UPI00356A9982
MKPENGISDQELLALLQRGDHAAFTALYNRYWEKLLLIAWNHTKDKIVAEDIVHEVFMVLWTKKINIQILNVQGFLATKIKFAVFKYYRKEQRRNRLAELHIEFNDLCWDEKKLDALFLKEYIDGIVANLPQKCKLVFIYSREFGLKNAEIASEMNISEKGVEANLTRALKIIRHNLEITGLLAIIPCEIITKILKG